MQQKLEQNNGKCACTIDVKLIADSDAAAAKGCLS